MEEKIKAIEFLKQQRAQQTEPFRKFYDIAIESISAQREFAGTNLERLRSLDASGLATEICDCDACNVCDYCANDGVCCAINSFDVVRGGRTVNDCCIEATKKWLLSKAKEENNEKRN